MWRELPNRDFRVAHKFIWRHSEVGGCRALPDAAGRIIDRPMTGTKVTTFDRPVVRRHAAEMGANADDNEPFRPLYPRCVAFRIAQLVHINAALGFDLPLRAVADENWLSAPFDRDNLSYSDICDVDVD